MWKIGPDTEIFITFQTNETRTLSVDEAGGSGPPRFQFVWVPVN